MSETRIANLGGGYAWDELWYDKDKDQFNLDSYHCGSVDICEDHYDGRRSLTREEALRQLLDAGCDYVKLIFRFEKELRLEETLASMVSSTTLTDFGWLARKDCHYFRITGEEFAVFAWNAFYSVKKGQPGRKDLSVVRRILEHSGSVSHWYWDAWRGGWQNRTI